MSALACVGLVMTLTVYVPALGGINGSMVNAQRMGLKIGHAACGTYWPRGTIFEIEYPLEGAGLRRVVECRDRGKLVGKFNLDLYGETWAQAKAVGKRSACVTPYVSWAAYRHAHSEAYGTPQY